MKKTSLLIGSVIAAGLTFSATANAQFSKDLEKNLNKVITLPSTGGGSAATGSSASQLNISEITQGLKEALKVGSERVVGQIGSAGGYENDPTIHIPLPEKLQQAQGWLNKLGLSSLADDVESRLNKGAEAAAPKTKELIWKAIEGMTLEDAQKIYSGPDNAATEYFKKVATPELTETVRPVIEEALNDAGAIVAYDKLVGQFAQNPLVPNVKSDLTTHATDMALEGLFHYLATEEAAIRNNPVARTTDILKSVFGGT
jgi:Protein of unknown function (DUF4197)